MGSGRWDPKDWDNYTKQQNYAGKSTQQIFTQLGIHPDLNPYGIKGRESCDSADNPASTAVIIGLDVTGSMRSIVDDVARKSLNTLVTEIYNRRPVSDPHIMIHGIGDVRAYDPVPFQITQFEADLRIAKQMELLDIHQGGGGNGSESYMLAWYFAAHHTTIDCFEKRGKKGYLFTIGDDGPTPDLTAEEIERVFGHAGEAVSRDTLLDLVSRKWEIFHVTLSQGDTGSTHVQQQWMTLLGENAITLADHTKLAEVIVSIMQIREGVDKDLVVGSWDGSTNMVVANAVRDLTKRATAADVVTL
jgi:hypothetical protein